VVSLAFCLLSLFACQHSPGTGEKEAAPIMDLPSFTGPGEKEEVPIMPSEVPAEVRATAEDICDRIGEVVVVVDWFWDIEDQCWECSLYGLPRSAELDITKDAGFSELELVYEIAEVEEALPEVADRIKEMCRSEHDPLKRTPFIELSLRRQEHLDSIPSLQQAWSLDGVVMEFQCPTGADFELDAKGMYVTRKLDDLD
jgi:hypothetical protein